MSIRGIDTQVMAHRTTDYVKDVSANLRRNDTNQDILAQQAREQASRAQEQVQTLQQKESARVKTEERKRQEARNGKKKKEAAQLTETTDLIVDSFVPDNPTVGTAVPYKLDIEV